MNRPIGVPVLLLALLLAGIVLVPVLWAGRVPLASSMFQSSILPIPEPASATPAQGITPVPTSGTVAPSVAPATVVFPTPPTPVPNALIISADQAIAIAGGQNPSLWDAQQQLGELTVSAKLTVHGDRQAGATGELDVHPLLPVWLVYVRLPTWTVLEGPAGHVVQDRYNIEIFEIDATTGKMLGGTTTFVPVGATPSIPGAPTAPTTPEAPR